MNINIAQTQKQVISAIAIAKQIKEHEFVLKISKKVEAAFEAAENRLHSSSYTTNYDPSEEVDFLNGVGVMAVTAKKESNGKDFTVIFNFRESSAEPTSEYGKKLESLAISLSSKLMNHFFHPVIAGLESGTTTFLFKHPIPNFILSLLESPASHPEATEIGGVYHLRMIIK